MKRFLFFLACFIFFATHAQAQDFEQFQTSQGLRVWMLPLSNAKTVNLVLHIPVGGRMDPKGKEGLAHFVEHMLFTDNDGRDELEFFKELEKKGGKANGYTSKDDTVYLVDAPAKEAPLALDWARRLLFDHQFKAEAVDKERKIVLLEANLSPKEPIDYIFEWRTKLGHMLSLPTFSEREFGIEEDDRDISGTFETLHAIGLADIQKFYDDFYPTTAMTLFITGNFDPASMKALIEKEFLARRPAPGKKTNISMPLKNPNRFRQEFYFLTSGALRYSAVQKFYDLDEEAATHLIFLKSFLTEYLNDELRFKDRSTYGISVDVYLKQNFATFSIYGDFSPENFDGSVEKINQSLDLLKNNRLSPEVFAEYQKRALDTLMLRAKTPQNFSHDFRTYFFNRAIFETFPNMEEIYSTVRPEDVQKFLQKWFVRENQVLTFNAKSPLSGTTEIIVVFFSTVLFLLFLRWHWLKPRALRQLRYVRKFYWPLTLWLIFLFVALVLYVLYFRIISVGAELAQWGYLGFSSYTLQSICETLALFSWIYLTALPFTFFPKKILLFEDGLMIKFLTFRSWFFPYKELFLLERISPWHLFNFRRYGFTFKLNPVFSKGVYVKGKKYPGVFFSTRNDPELLEVIRENMEKGKVS